MCILYFRETKEGLKFQTTALAEQFNGFKAHLVIIQVGGRDDSNVYIRQKIKSAAEIGVIASHVKFPKTITQIEVCKIITIVLYNFIFTHITTLITKLIVLIVTTHYGFFLFYSYCPKSINTTQIRLYTVL